MNVNAAKRPNIIYIMSDDHAAHAISAYGSRINKTPNIDRIAEEGMRFDNCFCTNSICAPSRAVILTGKYNHLCGVQTLKENFDSRQPTVPKMLQEGGYQTALIGKWHLGHGGISDPTGFDYWNVFIEQGEYHNPDMIEMGEKKTFTGYATDLVADFSIDWMNKRNKEQPFFLMCHHKAPHRPWEPDEKHKHMYENEEIPEPETFYDDYENRSEAASVATMRIDDLKERDTKGKPPEGLAPQEVKQWKYQRYIKDYLRCIASVDDNVGRILDYLDEEGIAEDTIVIYTSDQGFFLGDHGWYDKRFMYEESLRMPFLVRYPRGIRPSSINNDMILNLDFAETFLDYAELPVPNDMQGRSLRPLFNGETPKEWRTSMYYRYWMHYDQFHKVYSHYGIRTQQYKLIYYYGETFGYRGSFEHQITPEWEMFDLKADPYEMNNVYDSPQYAQIQNELIAELEQLQAQYKDEGLHRRHSG
ncbi:sulfatase [Paenibacillus oryzisoli]|uniref:sulfatase family protein n=1 Tax=Paenibacillus oryzisoli TaxID=1850517 RepID=UPI003D2A7B86